jgi:hyaluronoglucosaminidase
MADVRAWLLPAPARWPWPLQRTTAAHCLPNLSPGYLDMPRQMRVCTSVQAARAPERAPARMQQRLLLAVALLLLSPPNYRGCAASRQCAKTTERCAGGAVNMSDPTPCCRPTDRCVAKYDTFAWCVDPPQLAPNRSRYSVLWNSPWPSECEEHEGGAGGPIDWAANGVAINDGAAFNGEVVVDLYRTGMFPHFLANGSSVNGGLPQSPDFSLQQHLASLSTIIDEDIPSAGFRGVAVLDFEAWYPQWAWHGPPHLARGDQYWNQSLKLAAATQPSLKGAALVAAAKAAWLKGAQDVMIASIAHAKQMRPHGLWGYYSRILPPDDCVSATGVDAADSTAARNSCMAANDELSRLWEAVDAIMPSIYLSNNDTAVSRGGVDSYVGEASRLALAAGANRADGVAPLVIPFVCPTYHSYIDGAGADRAWQRWLGVADAQLDFARPAEWGAAGVVVWGGSIDTSTKEKCAEGRAAFDAVVSPVLQAVAAKTSSCAVAKCSGHGRCATLPTTACLCDQGWSGASCSAPALRSDLSPVFRGDGRPQLGDRQLYVRGGSGSDQRRGYEGTPASLNTSPPMPRCAGTPHAFTWFATVQHCMWIDKNNHSEGNSCPLLNDTLFELVYYAGDVVSPEKNLTHSVEQVKASLDLLPEGFRIVQAQNCHKINAHLEDNLLQPYKEGAACKNGTHFSGLWWDHGVKDLAADNTGFLQAYKAAGGKDIDAIVLDPELSMSEWAAGMLCAAKDPCCIAKLDAIQNDKRFPPLLAELQALGFKVDKSKPHWLHSALVPWTQCGIDGKAPDPCPTGYTDNVAIYNGWSSSRSSKQYDAAVTLPAQKIYPKINVNNYGDFTSNQRYCLPDQSGYTPCKIKGGAQPTVTGTQQAPCMYVWMENASVVLGLERTKQLPAGSRFDLTGWNGLLMGVNLMRMSTLSSKVPVVPWVGYKNDTNMSPFQWIKPMANTDCE